MFVIKDYNLNTKRLLFFKTTGNPILNNEVIVDLSMNWNKTIIQKYSLLVLDIDGTLRDIHSRMGGISNQLLCEIKRISEIQGVSICFATGRNTSISSLINDFIDYGIPSFYVIFGNGIKIVKFPEKKVIFEADQFSTSQLNEIKDKINEIEIDAKLIISNKMVRVFLSGCTKSESFKIYQKICELFPEHFVTHSGVNFEIVPNGVCKSKAILIISSHKQTLAIGDSGSIGGNDYKMLKDCSSFCVSDDYQDFIEWSIPVITSDSKLLVGPTATLYILRRMKQDE